jgi:hypothetical protein
MSFRKNPAQQMSLFDSTYNLTEREKKALERSWAKVFSEDVFLTLTRNVSQSFIPIRDPDRTRRSM